MSKDKDLDISAEELHNDELVENVEDDEEFQDEQLDEAQEPKGSGAGTGFPTDEEGVEDVKKAANATSKTEPPKSKAGVISKVTQHLSKMKKEDLDIIYGKLLDESIFAESKAEEVVENVDFEEDLNALVEAEESLSEGFRSKAATIFEAAVKSKVSAISEELSEQYAADLQEAKEAYQAELAEQADEYLTYVAKEWLEENRVAVESGLRAEMAESFMGAIKQVFVEHYVDVPEDKVNLVDELAEQVEKLEESMVESTNENLSLQEQIAELQREKIIREATEGLVATEAERLKSLVEDVDFEDVESFEQKVSTIKESYITKKSHIAESVTETFEEDFKETEVSPLMAATLKALNSNKSFK